MKLITAEKDGDLVVSITGDVDHHSAAGLREEIDRLLEEKKPSALLLDLGGTDFMDSSGLGLILGRVEKASALGIPVYVSGMNKGLHRLAKLAGLEKLKNLTLTK